MRKILIIGATSAIAHECAKKWAEIGAELFLVGRNTEKLKQNAEDLITRGAKKVETHTLDLNDLGSQVVMFQSCTQILQHIDIALIAHGTLPDQIQCEQDTKYALQEFSSNGLSVISLLTQLANIMEVQKSGTIAVISSVAGDRGRPSNYLYGSAKAAVTTFCQGLRARMHKVGVHVLTIKPGFVDTPMTQGLPLPKVLVSSPEKIASIVCSAIDKKRNMIYAPSFWRLIMLIIKNIPEFVFKKLKL